VEEDNIHVKLRHGAGSSSYAGGLKPGSMLGNLLQVPRKTTVHASARITFIA
jgi:hypothetical protein